MAWWNFVGDGHPQGVQSTGLLVVQVGEVVVNFEMAVGGGRVWYSRIGPSVNPATYLDNINVVFVSTAQAIV